MKKGFVLAELLVAVVIMALLALIVTGLVKNVMQKARIVSAKAQISQMAQLLEGVKVDTAFYPVLLQHLASETPPPMQEKGWDGAYTLNIPSDPWGTPYFYEIPPTTVLPPTRTKPRTTPTTIEYMPFQASPGKGRLLITNYGTTANRIWLNGKEVVHPSDLKNKPIPQIIEKEIDLLTDNVFEIRLTGGKNDYLFVEVTGVMPTKKYFVVGSYGRDRKQGGLKFDADISWRSDSYPNFQ